MARKKESGGRGRVLLGVVLIGLASGSCDELPPEDGGPIDEMAPEHTSVALAATKTKTIKVCGRRQNLGSPQSWWVDTGIYVAGGTSITIDGSMPGGSIHPWPGAMGWSPAGNPSSTGWLDSLAYRSGLTTPDKNVSFALIAKVGRGGIPVHVGASKTFPAPASGTLYLASNDGVNFEDNLGSWNVKVTFPTVVSFGPGYGAEAVFADRINTSLVDTWGVVLTVRADVADPALAWTPTFIGNLEAAFTAVQNRLGVGFSTVFGGLELRLTTADSAGSTTRSTNTRNLIRFGARTRGTVPRADNRAWGRITSSVSSLDYYPSAIPYGLNNAGDKGIRNTIIHELGHIFEYRTMTSTSASLFTYADSSYFRLRRMAPTIGTTDRTDDIGTFWENSSDDLVEIIADSFLNWVRNSFVGIENRIGSLPPPPMNQEQLRSWMYWTGGMFTNDIGVQVTSPGMSGSNGFRAAVASYVNTSGVAAFLRSLGNGNPAKKTGGDPDPSCAF